MTDSKHSCSDGRSASSCGSRRARHHHRGRRKERVLHTRVSEQLSDDIRRLAEDLRVPVSNLVRNVLEEVFTAVENVSDDVGEFFDNVIEEADGVRERIRNQQQAASRQRRGARRSRHGHRSASADASGDGGVDEELRRDEAAEAGSAPQPDAPASAPSADVLGWQPFVLNQATACTGCGNEIDPGGNAFLAISQAGGPGQIVCSSCTRG